MLILLCKSDSKQPAPGSVSGQNLFSSNCYIPQEDIDWLTQRTHYTSEEIQILYNGGIRLDDINNDVTFPFSGFQRDFPDGGILRSHFEIFFLNGKAGNKMANLVFK